MRRFRNVQVGILLRNERGDGTRQALTMVSSGECWAHHGEDIFFHFPHFLNQRELAACGTNAEPLDEAQTRARLSALVRLREFERETERVFQALGRSFLKVYPVTANSDPNAWGQVSLRQATSLLDMRPDPPASTLLAMHQHLMTRSDCFLSGVRKHRTRQTFRVRPRAEVRLSESVRGMLMAWSPELVSFIEKARKIVLEYRRHRAANADKPPSQIRLSLPEFTASDWDIINYIKLHIAPRRMSQLDIETMHAMHIIKKTELYDGILNEGAVHKFLCELGIFAPWDDPSYRDRKNHEVADLDFNAAKEFHAEVQPPPADFSSAAPSEQSPVRDLTLTEEDYYRGDIVSHLRRDWGDMPAFVIDDTTAHELDDGISVEPCPDRGPGHDWVHVHVADPTAYIHPDHAISRHAFCLMTTRYLNQGTTPLLPDFLSKLAHFGATADMAKGEGLRVVTFSSLIGPEGGIVDAKVSAGIVRNARLLTYQGVNKKLNLPSIPTLFPFGQKLPSKPEREPSEADIPHLHYLNSVLSRVIQLRYNQGFYSFGSPQYEIAVSPQRLPGHSTTDLNKPTYFAGYPTQEYRVLAERANDCGAHSIVQESMKLAGRAASICFSRASIPALRRGSLGRPTFVESAGNPLEAEERVLAMRDESGFLPYSVVSQLGIIMPPTRPTLKPTEHFFMGVPAKEGYCRVTSPLRRYLDLMLHWQVKHMLLGGSPETAPFTMRYWIQNFANLVDRERTLDVSVSRHIQYWGVRYLQEQVLSDPTLSAITYDMIVESSPTWNALQYQWSLGVKIPALGIYARARVPSDDGFHIGMQLRGRLSECWLGMTSYVWFDLAKDPLLP
jgi:exoribonuclease-2